MSFALHADGSLRRELVERAANGESPIGLMDYLVSAEFWFESFRNWQSESLAVLSLVVLSIWLRQKDSPQSKPLKAPRRLELDCANRRPSVSALGLTASEVEAGLPSARVHARANPYQTHNESLS